MRAAGFAAMLQDTGSTTSVSSSRTSTIFTSLNAGSSGPVLIARRLFAAIRACDPGAGAKSVVRQHASEAGDVPVADRGAFIDIDTPAEYATLPDLRRQLGW